MFPVSFVINNMRKTVLNITLAILVSSPSLGQDARIDKYIALGDT